MCAIRRWAGIVTCRPVSRFMIGDVVGAAGAPLVAAGGLLVFCVVLMAVAHGILRYHRAPSSTAAPGLQLGEAIRLFSENKGTVLLAALVAGLVAGNSGRRR